MYELSVLLIALILPKLILICEGINLGLWDRPHLMVRLNYIGHIGIHLEHLRELSVH